MALSVLMMCERALGLLNGSDLRDLDGEARGLLVNLNYDGLMKAFAQREALLCARHFPGVRDRLLTAHPWLFARKFAAAAQFSGPLPLGWAFAFTLPSDCVKVLAVTRDDRGVSRRTLFRNYEVIGKTLMANVSPVYVTYTARTTDTTLWDGLFSDAFCSLLAGEIGVSIAADARVIGLMEQRAAASVAAAQASGLIAPVAQLPFELPKYLDYSGVPTGNPAPFWDDRQS
jgi:hypothetical protein